MAALLSHSYRRSSAADRQSVKETNTVRVSPQANANNADLSKRLKSAEGMINDLTRRNDDLSAQNAALSGDNSRLQAELSRIKNILLELESRCDMLSRENNSLKGEWRTECMGNYNNNNNILYLI